MSPRKRAAAPAVVPPPASAPKRRRRAPDEARDAILGAADRLLRTGDPEHVGLKDVATEAGVTHGLVAHYFGTYAGLVRAVLARRSQAAGMEVAERLLQARADGSWSELTSFVFDFVTDVQRVRLAAWLSFQHDPKPLGADGSLLPVLVEMVDQALAAARTDRGEARVPREAIEQAVLLTLAAGTGYAMRGARWEATLGIATPDEGRARFLETLRTAVRAIVGEAPTAVSVTIKA